MYCVVCSMLHIVPVYMVTTQYFVLKEIFIKICILENLVLYKLFQTVWKSKKWSKGISVLFGSEDQTFWPPYFCQKVSQYFLDLSIKITHPTSYMSDTFCLDPPWCNSDILCVTQIFFSRKPAYGTRVLQELKDLKFLFNFTQVRT